MNEELNKVLQNAEIKKRLDSQGIDIVGGSSDAARVFIDRQIEIWAKVVKDNDIKAE
jgi:tripartite-type tricarboxylate transporter receptor subunit TctC